MWRSNKLFIIRSLVIIVISVFGVRLTLSALTPGQQANSYTVLASVEPARYIIVDNNLQITQIVSNTAEDVVPYVVMNSLDGSQLPYTNSVRDQFLALKPSLTFSTAGIVYKRHTSGTLLGALERAATAVRKFIFGQ